MDNPKTHSNHNSPELSEEEIIIFKEQSLKIKESLVEVLKG